MSTVYDSRIEKLIEAAVADGVLTDQERRVLINNANNYGYDLDEFEMYVNSKLFEAQQRLKATAPKSNKVGEIKKCPNCGATVDTAMVKCPECGYNFGGVEANSSAKRLEKLLSECNEDGTNILKQAFTGIISQSFGKIPQSKKSSIIINFPVPTTKADLLEFMADMKYRAKHYDELGDEGLASAYNTKYKECAEKAHIYFENDPDFKYLFEKEAEFKKFSWKNFSKRTKMLIIAIIVIIFLYGFEKLSFHETSSKSDDLIEQNSSVDDTSYDKDTIVDDSDLDEDVSSYGSDNENNQEDNL